MKGLSMGTGWRVVAIEWAAIPAGELTRTSLGSSASARSPHRISLASSGLVRSSPAGPLPSSPPPLPPRAQVGRGTGGEGP